MIKWVDKKMENGLLYGEKGRRKAYYSAIIPNILYRKKEGILNGQIMVSTIWYRLFKE